MDIHVGYFQSNATQWNYATLILQIMVFDVKGATLFTSTLLGWLFKKVHAKSLFYVIWCQTIKKKFAHVWFCSFKIGMIGFIWHTFVKNSAIKWWLVEHGVEFLSRIILQQLWCLLIYWCWTAFNNTKKTLGHPYVPPASLRQPYAEQYMKTKTKILINLNAIQLMPLQRLESHYFSYEAMSAKHTIPLSNLPMECIPISESGLACHTTLMTQFLQAQI